MRADSETQLVLDVFHKTLKKESKRPIAVCFFVCCSFMFHKPIMANETFVYPGAYWWDRSTPAEEIARKRARRP